MAAPGNVISFPGISTKPSPPLSKTGRRSITPQAGRALNLLAHAIEYLVDEHVLRADAFRPDDPDVEAIHILMSLNRQVYFDCPPIPSVVERLHALFRPRTT